MSKEVNLEEILKYNLSDFRDNGFSGLQTFIPRQIPLILLAMKEACRQTLELAAKNACILRSDAPLCGCPECYADGVDRESIMETINQIK